MREIKFRGWDEKNKEMVYNINLLFSNRLNDCFEEYEECGLKIMQYTGLKDKNGKEIYEGDILSIVVFEDNAEYKGSVSFNNGGFCFDVFVENEIYNIQLSKFEERVGESLIEIIGNIHENPELLEVHHE